MSRPPEFLVFSHGIFVSARAAAYLLRYAGLDAFRINHRGDDPEIDATLVAMTIVALQWRSDATGTKEAARPELDRTSEWLSTRQVATQLHISESGVRKAIRERRLDAESVAGRYRVNREQLAHFTQRRTTH